MAAPLERPETPLSAIVVGAAIAVILALFVLRLIVGFVITLTKIGIAIAIVVAIVVAMRRLTDGDDD